MMRIILPSLLACSLVGCLLWPAQASFATFLLTAALVLQSLNEDSNQ